MRSDWTATTLGSLVREGSADYQTGPFGTMLKASEYSVDGSPLISVGEIREGFFTIHDDTPRVCEKTKQRLPQFVLAEGDIVFGRKGAIHRNAIVSKAQAGWFLGSDGIRLRVTKKHDPVFLSYFLRTPMISRWLIANSQGAIMPTLNESILDRVPLFLPSKSEQQRISSVLSTLDAKIELNQRMNEELEGMAKLLYDYWFVQYDFPMSAAQAAALGKPHLQGHPYRASGGPTTYHVTLKREIPKGWDVGAADALFDFNPTTKLKDGTVAGYFDMDAVPTRGFMTKMVQRKAFSGGTKFMNGDVVVARITPCLENGKTALITQLEEDEVGFGSTEFIVLRGKTRSLSAFGACMARSETFRKFAITNMTGTSGRKRIDAPVLKTYPVSIPPSELLVRFEEICFSMFQQMTLNEQQTQELTTLRDWLLPMLMNGQVTVG